MAISQCLLDFKMQKVALQLNAGSTYKSIIEISTSLYQRIRRMSYSYQSMIQPSISYGESELMYVKQLIYQLDLALMLNAIGQWQTILNMILLKKKISMRHIGRQFKKTKLIHSTILNSL